VIRSVVVPCASLYRRALLAVVASLLGGCGIDAADEDDRRSAAVFEAVVRWLAAEESGDPAPLPVFVEPRGERATIPLPVQAELISATSDVAVVRFIDAREEALVDEGDAGVSVKGHGVLVRLSPVPEHGSPIALDVDVLRNGSPSTTMRFQVRGSDVSWSVDGVPLELPS
jgi:hypothetical protein